MIGSRPTRFSVFGVEDREYRQPLVREQDLARRKLAVDEKATVVGEEEGTVSRWIELRLPARQFEGSEVGLRLQIP
jgi:hypothetical protein